MSSPSAAAKARRFNQREAEEEPEATIDDYDSDDFDEEQAIISEDTYNTISERFLVPLEQAAHHPLHCAGLLTDPEFQHQPGLLEEPRRLLRAGALC